MEVKIVKTKLAGIFMAFICLAMVTGAFAATPTNVMPIYKTKIIKLESNPSTGYHWVAKYNKTQVILVKKSFKVNNPGLIGSPGIETFIFEGVKGSKIVLNYIGPGDAEPLKTVSYTL